jgi:hypothetical protein
MGPPWTTTSGILTEVEGLKTVLLKFASASYSLGKKLKMSGTFWSTKSGNFTFEGIWT